MKYEQLQVGLKLTTLPVYPAYAVFHMYPTNSATEAAQHNSCTNHGVFLWLLLHPGGHPGSSSLPQSHSGQLDESSHAGGHQGRLLVVVTKLVVTLHLSRYTCAAHYHQLHMENDVQHTRNE